LQEIDGTSFQRPPCGRHGPVAGQDNDRQERLASAEIIMPPAALAIAPVTCFGPAVPAAAISHRRENDFR